MNKNYQVNVENSLSSQAAPDGGASPEAAPQTFADFGVAEGLCRNLEKQGIITPFPIQKLTLPLALKGRDVIGQAKTGTGKTLGFALPLLMRCLDYKQEHPASSVVPLALVMLPTRELAQQVYEEIVNASLQTGLRTALLCGGHPMRKQILKLQRGCEIIVGTPGRLLDLYRQKQLRLDQVKVLVLDEADEMLDLGFLDSVESLIKATPPNRQTLLFSATMPTEIISLSKRYLQQAIHVQAHEENTRQASSTAVNQLVYRCHPLNKNEVTARILQARNRGLTIIFTPTKRKASDVAHDLKCRGFAVAELHGDLKQVTRDQALKKFRNGKIDVLVATDVAARGIDVEEVTHVINYQCPDSAKTYIHRVGRTGRAGKAGTAITFVDWEELMRWKLIAKELNQSELEPVETYHTSPHLYTDLDIPESAGAKVISKVLTVLDGENPTEQGEHPREKTGRAAKRSGSRRRRTVKTKNASAKASPNRAASGKSDQPSNSSVKNTSQAGSSQKTAGRVRRRTIRGSAEA